MKNSPDKQLNKVVTSDPINRTAALVTSRGAHFNAKLKPLEKHFFSDVPKNTQSVYRATCVNPDFQDLTGLTFGRFTVVGYTGSASVKRLTGVLINGMPLSQRIPGGARWLVKCACGNYEIRSTKAIKNPDNRLDACRACRQWQHLRRSEYKKRHGQWPPDDYGW